jgi:hypothetical protein
MNHLLLLLGSIQLHAVVGMNYGSGTVPNIIPTFLIRFISDKTLWETMKSTGI